MCHCVIPNHCFDSLELIILIQSKQNINISVVMVLRTDHFRNVRVENGWADGLKRKTKRRDNQKSHQAMSYDFAFGHPIIYEEPKVPELEEKITLLRDELKFTKKRLKSEVAVANNLRHYHRKYEAMDKIFDEYIIETKKLKDEIKDLKTENEILKSDLVRGIVT